MGKADLTEKILEDYNDVFADIVNVLLFKGEERVIPDLLTNSRVHSQYKDFRDKLHEQERDVLKFWNGGSMRNAVIGIENQTRPEKQMPLRISGYEGASYREQLGNSKLYPVVTLILYFGTERRWNYRGALKEIIEIPEYMDEYVNNVKVNVFEIAWLPEETISKFTSDFKVVAKFFSEKRKNKYYEPDDRTTIQHVDAVLKLLLAMTHDKRYEKVLSTVDGKEVRNMCEVAERLEARGREEGRTEIVKLMLASGKTPEQISDFCGLDLDYVREIEETIKKY